MIAEGLSFLTPKISPQDSNGVTHNGGAECRSGRLKSATFDKYLAITQKRYKIDAYHHHHHHHHKRFVVRHLSEVRTAVHYIVT